MLCCPDTEDFCYDEPESPRFLYTFPLSDDQRTQYEKNFPRVCGERAKDIWYSGKHLFVEMWQILTEYACLRDKIRMFISDKSKPLMFSGFDDEISFDSEGDMFLYIRLLRKSLHLKIKRILSSSFA